MSVAINNGASLPLVYLCSDKFPPTRFLNFPLLLLFPGPINKHCRRFNASHDPAQWQRVKSVGDGCGSGCGARGSVPTNGLSLGGHHYRRRWSRSRSRTAKEAPGRCDERYHGLPEVQTTGGTNGRSVAIDSVNVIYYAYSVDVPGLCSGLCPQFAGAFVVCRRQQHRLNLCGHFSALISSPPPPHSFIHSSTFTETNVPSTVPLFLSHSVDSNIKYTRTPICLRVRVLFLSFIRTASCVGWRTGTSSHPGPSIPRTKEKA